MTEAQRSLSIADRRLFLSRAVKGATPEQLDKIERILRKGVDSVSRGDQIGGATCRGECKVEDQELLDLEETRSVTIGQIMDMREALDVAFAEKIGAEPASGFNVEINSNCPERVRIWGGYESFGSGFGACVPSTEFSGSTPKEVFEYAMAKISAYEVPTKEDKIKLLREQIEALEND